MNNDSKILKISISIFFIALLFSFIYLYIKSNKTVSRNNVENNVSWKKQVQNETREEEIVYTNERYGFSIKHPRLLYVNEIEDSEDYIFFVRFEETKYSTSKGFAVGVSSDRIEDSFQKIELGLGEDFRVEGERRYEFEGREIFQKTYQSVEGGEGRTIGVFDAGDYTFSISARPEDIEKVLSGFSLINNNKGIKNELSCEGDEFCPSGFHCVDSICQPTS